MSFEAFPDLVETGVSNFTLRRRDHDRAKRIADSEDAYIEAETNTGTSI